jgi:hypothetical protein
VLSVAAVRSQVAGVCLLIGGGQGRNATTFKSAEKTRGTCRKTGTLSQTTTSKSA